MTRTRCSGSCSRPSTPDCQDIAVDEANPTPTVTVRGVSVIRAEPDEAMLWITLTALEDGPGEALADVSTRASALAALLDELGVAKADRSTSGITVAEEFDHTQEGRRSLGHRASSGTSVRLTDPDLIGRLVAKATEDLGARIAGPRWLISLDNPVAARGGPRSSGRCPPQSGGVCRGGRRNGRPADPAERARRAGRRDALRAGCKSGVCRAHPGRAGRARRQCIDPGDLRARSRLTGRGLTRAGHGRRGV